MNVDNSLQEFCCEWEQKNGRKAGGGSESFFSVCGEIVCVYVDGIDPGKGETLMIAMRN